MTAAHDPEALRPYLERFDLIPLTGPRELIHGKPGGKIPAGKWLRSPSLDLVEAAAHMTLGKNIGVRLTDADLVLDIDPRHGGDESLSRLAGTLGVDFNAWPIVRTGSGGQHIYMHKPANTRISGKLRGYPGIDLKTAGGFVVAAGSVHPNGNAYTWDDDLLAVPLDEIRDAPANLIELLRRTEAVASSEPGEITPDGLLRLLGCLNVTDYTDDESAWRDLMMASHHATGGAGLAEFVQWSIGDPAYADAADSVTARWYSLGGKPGGITASTLFKAVFDAGHGDVVKAVTARSDFDDVDDDDIELSDRTRQRNDNDDVAERFVWVADAECFVRCSDSKQFSKEQFRSLYAGAWQEGDILNAIWRDKLPMRKFESLVYLPWEPEVVANGHGGECYNLWRDSSINPKEGDVSVFLEHMAYLFPDETERELAIDYLALLTRKPAVKINFAMLVRGKQGTGKSWLGALVATIMGHANVSRPNSAIVVEKYTDWQLGKQLAIIEELMANGRMDVANRMKSSITDPYLNIRPMYGKAYTVPNRLNFISFTNHDDALPIENGDRRWLVFFSPAVPAGEEYYARLFQFLDGDGPAAVAHWLEQRDVKLNPKGVAPMTRGKAEMRMMSMGDVEQHLSDLLAAGDAPFDFGLVRVDDVLGAVPERYTRQVRNLRNRVIKWLQEEAGAAKVPRYTKGGRPSVQLWSIADHGRWAEIGAAACNDAYHSRFADG